jgi:dienelactone hydrolase
VGLRHRRFGRVHGGVAAGFIERDRVLRPIDREGAARRLLLVFGGRDEQITEAEIERIRQRLQAAGKQAEIQIYANVGHSFFRESSDTMASREIADAWDRVQSFLRKYFK